MMDKISMKKEYTIFWVTSGGEERGYSKIKWNGGYLKHPSKNIILLDFDNINNEKTYTLDNTYFKKNALITKTLKWKDANKEMPI